MRAEAGSDAALVTAVLSRFRTGAFSYTLEPPLLPQVDSLDAFLFLTQRGFCEHYAAAFVYLMRAAGVPARVVAGYQGGEVNPVNRTVIVHQFDAHAWAEVWLQGQGWVRVDPTAAVSPDRIEWGLERAMAGEGGFLSNSPLSPLRYRSIAWVNTLRLRYDALTYRWQLMVVGFDREQQFRILNDWFDGISIRKFVFALLGAWVLVLVPVALSLLRGRRTHTLAAMDKYYLKFCARLARRGVVREPGETPDQFFARAALELPAQAPALTDITGLYQRLAYGGDLSVDQRGRLLVQLRRAVRQFRPGRVRPGRVRPGRA